MDEFLITATSHSGETRTWTRNNLEAAKAIADAAIKKLWFVKAEVRNTYGGVVSDPLYTKELGHP